MDLKQHRDIGTAIESIAEEFGKRAVKRAHYETAILFVGALVGLSVLAAASPNKKFAIILLGVMGANVQVLGPMLKNFIQFRTNRAQKKAHNKTTKVYLDTLGNVLEADLGAEACNEIIKDTLDFYDGMRLSGDPVFIPGLNGAMRDYLGKKHHRELVNMAANFTREDLGLVGPGPG